MRLLQRPESLSGFAMHIIRVGGPFCSKKYMGLQRRDIRKGMWHAIPTHKLEAHGRAMAQGLRPKAHAPRTTPEAQVPSPSVHLDA